MNTNNPESAGQQAQFSQDPQLVNPKRDIVEIAWETTRLQKRYVEKVGQISMQLVVSEELPTQAHVDASRARQIISNLLGNAIKVRERTRPCVPPLRIFPACDHRNLHARSKLRRTIAKWAADAAFLSANM